MIDASTTDPSQRKQMKRRVGFLFLGIAIFATAVYFWNLGGFAMTDTDEATHAMVVREMRERGDVLTLHYLGGDYFRKPPLAFWLRAGAESVFGETEFALRFFSALAGVATTLILAWWAWLLTRRTGAALLAGMIFPLLPITHIHTFRSGDTDGILIALLTWAAFLFWRSMTKPRYLLGAAAVLALALMDKSAAIAPLVLAGGLTLLALRRWPYSRALTFGSVGVFLAVALPWHIQQYLAHGSAFVDEYLKYHILQRTTDAITASSGSRGTFWYFKAAEKGMFPWTWLLLAAFAAVFSRLRSSVRDHAAELLLFLWGAATFILYSLARTKLDWYIAPAYVPWTILLALLFSRPFDHFPRWLQLLSGLSFIAFLLRAAYLARSGVRAAFPFATQFGLWKATAALAFIGVGVLVISLLLAKKLRLPSRRFLAVGALLPFFLSGIHTFIGYSRTLEPESPLRIFRRAIDARDPSATVILVEPFFGDRPAVRWYLSDKVTDPRLIALNGDATQLPQQVEGHPGGFVVVSKNRALETDMKTHLTTASSFRDLVLYQISP